MAADTPTPAAPERLPADEDLPAAGPPIVFDAPGLSQLYVQFFSSQDQLTLLSRRLGALGLTQSAALEVAWDEANKVGTITLFVPEEDRRGEALLPSLEAGEPVPVQRLSILMQPLGLYRGALAERFDLRILSFSLKLGFWDRNTGSYCTAAGALNDPAGTRLGPCFRCLEPRAGVLELCRDGDTWPAPMRGDARGLRMLKSALRSQPAG